MSTIDPSVFKFLKNLGNNNDRDWFAKHKDEYTACHEHVIAFAEGLLSEMSKQDEIETATGKKSLYRIYRDTRFSKDKTPYKTHWGGYLRRATKQLRGGYYFHIEPGNTFIGGGFWGPNKDDLLRIRQEFEQDDSEIRKIIGSSGFVKTFGELRGGGVKTAPKGFDKEHPAIDLIRKKQFIIYREFTDKEALHKDFIKNVAKTYGQMRPFFDYMSEVLTTDANGIPLYD
jgi:uncharacterized protein (TIGR02453 family)